MRQPFRMMASGLGWFFVFGAFGSLFLLAKHGDWWKGCQLFMIYMTFSVIYLRWSSATTSAVPEKLDSANDE